MRRRFLILHNRLAGPRRAHRRLSEVVDRLGHLGCDVELCEPDGPEAGRRIALAAIRNKALDAVVVAGGDGTVRQTASCLVGTPMPLGIIPVGTGNVMAREIGLTDDAEAIAACLTEGPIARVNSARANGEIFFLMVGAGFDGRVIAWLNAGLKQHLGKLAYAWPGIRSLLAGPDRLQVRIDGKEFAVAWAVATLRRRYAGSFVLSPDAGLEAGGIRTVMFNPGGRLAMLGNLIAVAAGRVSRQAGVLDVAGHIIEIGSALPVPVQIDGEPFSTTPVRIVAGGPLLSLIVPRSTIRAG